MRPLAAIAVLVAALPAQGKVHMTTEQALDLAFPECDVERTMHTLDDARRERATELAGREIDRALVYAYVARKQGEVVGTAYFDVHRVRTLRETVMVVLTPEQTIERIELLAFGEPQEYAARPVFYRQFAGKTLDDDLNLKRGIDGMTGATLTARASVDCARRVLAVHRVLAEAQEPEPEPEPKPEPPADRPTSRPTTREAPASKPTPAPAPEKKDPVP